METDLSDAQPSQAVSLRVGAGGRLKMAFSTLRGAT
jgi:hypothetical protein